MWQDGVDLTEQVRTNLAAARRRAGLSLDELAERTGLSASTISRLETGSRKITLEHLGTLAAGLGVLPDELLSPTERVDDPRISPRPIKLPRGIRAWALSPPSGASDLRAHKVRMPELTGPPDPQVHPGHEWLYVLAGAVRLQLDGVDHILHVGEAAEFSTLVPHWMGGHGGPAELLIIGGPHGERIHFHTAPGGTS